MLFRFAQETSGKYQCFNNISVSVTILIHIAHSSQHIELRREHVRMLPSEHQSDTAYLQILQKSCVEIFNVEPSGVCVNGRYTGGSSGQKKNESIQRWYLKIEIKYSVSESFNIVLRGRGFTQGRSSEGVVCTLSVNQREAYSKLNLLVQNPSAVYVVCFPALRKKKQQLMIKITDDVVGKLVKRAIG